MELITTKPFATMSSREIAELTGKEHYNVKRDISAMVLQLNYPDLQLKDCPKFDPSELKGHQITLAPFEYCGNTYDEFHLDQEYSLLLVSGYKVGLRQKIIKRWQELELQQAPKIPQTMSEALQLAADQARQLEEQAPKVAFVENLVERDTLMTATQVGQKHKISAVKLNKFLDELGGVYNKSVKRGRAFTQSFIDKGYGELKQTEPGYSQALFTPSGEVWINEKLISEGLV